MLSPLSKIRPEKVKDFFKVCKKIKEHFRYKCINPTPINFSSVIESTKLSTLNENSKTCDFDWQLGGQKQ